jgi:hypothetical protein
MNFLKKRRAFLRLQPPEIFPRPAPPKISYNSVVRKLIGFVMFLSLITACRQQEMQSYSVPKEADVAVGSSGESGSGAPLLLDNPPPLDSHSLPEGHPPLSGGLPPGHPPLGAIGEMTMENAVAQGLTPPSAPTGEVTWVVPAGWIEKPGSGFRYATFFVPGPGGLMGELSVTVLEGDAGGLLSNVNRWRGQIGLSGLTESEMAAHSKKNQLVGTSFSVFNFVSDDPLIDGKFKKRLLTAVRISRGKSWFFKLTGEDTVVQSAEVDFFNFLQSVKGF